jgi:hypothetical protein
MNKLITTVLGGMPLDLDDISFFQDAIREAFYGLVSAFGISPTDSFILSGCVLVPDPVPGPSMHLTAGYIAYNGEIWKVDAVNGLDSSIPYYWIPDSPVYDPTGLETFENGSTNNTYEVRKMKLVSGTPPAQYMPSDAPTLASKIIAINSTVFAKKVQENWTPVTTANGWNVGDLRYRKSTGGMVSLSGIPNHQSYDDSKSVIGNLPVGYRPIANKVFPVYLSNGSIDIIIMIVVRGNGDIEVLSPTPRVPVVADFYMDSIHFYVD